MLNLTGMAIKVVTKCERTHTKRDRYEEKAEEDHTKNFKLISPNLIYHNYQSTRFKAKAITALILGTKS